MADDGLPTPTKGVYIFFEFIALGFVLVAIEQIYSGSSWRIWFGALALGALFLAVGVMGPTLTTTLSNSVAWLRTSRSLRPPIAKIVSGMKRQQKPIFEYLGLGNAGGMHWTVAGSRYYMQTVAIRNAQTLVANSANSVAARVDFASASGDHFIVPEAVWLREDEHQSGSIATGLTKSLNLRGNETQRFVLMLVDDDGMPNATKDMVSIVKNFTAGQWTAKILVSADNCKSLSHEIVFTVLETENRFRYDSR